MSEPEIKESKKFKLSFQKSVVTYILAALVSIICGVFLSYRELDKEYIIKGELVSLFDNNEYGSFVLSSAEFIKNTDGKAGGQYRITGEDPQIKLVLPPGGARYDGVIIELSEPDTLLTPVSVYWTKDEGAPYIGALSSGSFIKKGETKVFLKLPAYNISSLRVDIDEDCELKDIVTAAGGFKINRYAGRSFAISLVIKAALIFTVLLFSYKAYKKEKSQSDNLTIKPYFAQYDYLRIIATVFVIALHLLNDTYMPTVQRGDAGYAFFKFIEAIVISCNVIYVLISGALVLRPSNEEETIGQFYKKRLLRVVIPMLCYFTYYAAQVYPYEIFKNGAPSGIKNIVFYLLAGRSPYTAHFWLVYVIIGLYIAAPFLKKLVGSISENQLFVLIVLIFVFNICITYLPVFNFYFGLEVSFSAWTGIFLTGFYLTTQHAKKRYPVFVILGVMAFAGSFATHYLRPELLSTVSNEAPLMQLMGTGIFVLVTMLVENEKDLGKRLQRKNKVIASLSKYSYGMLLIHLYFLSEFVLPSGWRYEAEHGRLKLTMLGMLIITFLISYVFAFIYDNTAVKCAMSLFKPYRKRS